MNLLKVFVKKKKNMRIKNKIFFFVKTVNKSIEESYILFLMSPYLFPLTSTCETQNGELAIRKVFEHDFDIVHSHFVEAHCMTKNSS